MSAAPHRMTLGTPRRIEGGGTAEARWQQALPAARVPIRSVASVLAAQARLVIVAPHPDDEVLACGGLLALHAAAGGAILVIAVSDGEASHAASAAHRPEQLAATRRAESAEGLRRLGADAARTLRFGLPDGRVVDHADALVRRLRRELIASDVVVSTWRLDGHPDHEATGSAAVCACAAAGCRLLEAPVWMWHWAEPGDPRVPWQRMIGVDIGAAPVARKCSALAAHTSQLVARDAQQGPVLGAAILARAARRTEYYFA